MAEIKYQISPSKTLRSMSPGDEVSFLYSQVKAETLRTLAIRLNKEGHEYKVSTSGMITKVTRIK